MGTEPDMAQHRINDAIVVQSLGFSGDFVLRTITKHNPSKLVLIAVYSDEKSWRKVMNAFNDINSICSRLGIEVRLEKIDVADTVPLQRIVYHIRRILRRELENKNNSGKPLLLVPMGGPRILTIALLLAAMGLTKYLRSRVLVRIEGEAFEYTYVAPLEEIIPLDIDEAEREVLRGLIESYMEKMDGVGPTELAARLGKPKTTVHRRLSELVNKGLASVEKGKYWPTLRGYLSA